MKKMFLIGASVACFAFVGCSSNDKDVAMSETSDSCCAKAEACDDCTEAKAASPAVVGDKSHCEGQTGECPFSKNEN